MTHVQGFGPKVIAVALARLTNSPAVEAFRQPFSFENFKGADLKTIRLNNEQRRWMRGYLRTNKEYAPDDPFIQLLRALLERPEVTDIQLREDQWIVQVMLRKMGG